MISIESFFKVGKAKYLVNYRIFLFLARQLSRFPYDPVELEKLQAKKLRKLLHIAYNRFDFYKGLMHDAKLTPESFKEKAQLNAIKPIKKHDYRTFIEQEVKRSPEKYAGYCIEQTSGSSGMPLTTYRTWKEKSNYLARFLRPFFVNGYSVFDKTLCIIPERRVTRGDSIVQKLGLLKRISVPNTWSSEKIIETYNKEQAEVFYANLSNLTQLALHLKSENKSIHHPKFYFSVAESLDENAKEIVKSVFGDNILNHYGSIELGTMAFQELGKQFLHFMHDTHLLEVLDKNYNPADIGNIVVTDLDIHSFPIIRYELGDSVESSMIDGIRVINKIVGRSDDLLTMSNGTKRSANVFAGIFSKQPKVRQFKIIQSGLNELDIKLVTENGEDRENLKSFLSEKISAELGDEFAVKFEFVPYIAQEKNGKLAKFVSHID